MYSAAGRCPFNAVVVAASAGGVHELQRLLSALPEELPVPVVIVQHRSASPAEPHNLERVLQYRSRLPVIPVTEGDPLLPGCVYVAPAGRHLALAGNGLFSETVCRLSDGPKVNGFRPAADVLFSSAAEHFGERVLALVLTGFAADGAVGASEIRRRGGIVMVQRPDTCFASSMPVAVLAHSGADFVLPPEAVPHAIVSLTMVPGAPVLFGLPLAA